MRVTAARLFSSHVRKISSRAGRPDFGAQRRAQLSLAINLGIIAVGLPLTWNAVVSWKHSTAAAARASSPTPPSLADVAREEQHRLAVQVLVDERRVARGLAPYFAPRLPENSQPG